MKLLGLGATEKPSGYDNLKESEDAAMEAAKTRMLDGEIAVMELEPKKPENNYVMFIISRTVFTFSMFMVAYFIFYSALNYYYTNTENCQHGLRYQNKTYICMSRSDIAELRKDIEVLKKVMDPALLFSADDETVDKEEKEEMEEKEEKEKEKDVSIEDAMLLGSRLIKKEGKTYKVSAYMRENGDVISEKILIKRHSEAMMEHTKNIYRDHPELKAEMVKKYGESGNCSESGQMIIKWWPVVHIVNGKEVTINETVIHCLLRKINPKEAHAMNLEEVSVKNLKGKAAPQSNVAPMPADIMKTVEKHMKETKDLDFDEMVAMLATTIATPQHKVTPQPKNIEETKRRIVQQIQETIRKAELEDANPNELPKEALDEWNEIKSKHAEAARNSVPTH